MITSILLPKDITVSVLVAGLRSVWQVVYNAYIQLLTQLKEVYCTILLIPSFRSAATKILLVGFNCFN